MFKARVRIGGKTVREERIATLPELKSFAYGIFLSPAVASLHDEKTGGMLMIDCDGVCKVCSKIQEDDDFLRKFKKSQYATL